jgi:hypothetical protein
MSAAAKNARSGKNEGAPGEEDHQVVPLQRQIVAWEHDNPNPSDEEGPAPQVDYGLLLALVAHDHVDAEWKKNGITLWRYRCITT